MSKPPTHTSALAHPLDDAVVPFATRANGVSGRLVRLGPAVDKILSSHDYAAPVSTALGEAIVLAALLGSALKFEGQLILQTKTDGPLGMLVADYRVPGHLRGYAGVDATRLAPFLVAAGKPAALQAELLGTGTLAMTIDPGGDGGRAVTSSSWNRRNNSRCGSSVGSVSS
jgi:molecular chaperone Hsp33